MAIIYSYPITTPQDSDLFIISRVPDGIIVDVT
jgi:hypothetical protein